MHSLLDKLSPSARTRVDAVIKNELISYHPVSHEQPLLDLIWAFTVWISDRRPIRFEYTNVAGEDRSLFGLPVGLIFDTYYFYVIIHFRETENHPARDAQYRLDRFSNIEPFEGKIPYPNQRLEEGQIRQTNNLMQIGQTITAEFEFSGSIEAALDKFPFAKIKRAPTEDRPALIHIAAVNRNGLLMWLLSQGNQAKVIAPPSLKNDLKQKAQDILALY
jgi:predicted DNA-binding transcriptional regulator YafY